MLPPETRPEPQQKPTGRKRARQTSDWLSSIRPYVDDFGALPRGKQRPFLADLEAKTGIAVNTLMRYILAARMLAGHGVTEFPKTRKFVPVASVEIIERIGKHFPERGREILKDFLEGGWSTNDLRDEWARLSKKPKLEPQRKYRRILFDKHLLAEKLNRDPREVVLRDYRDFPINGPDLFTKLAYPVAFAELLDNGKRAVVFDEEKIAWPRGHASATREFLRSIAIAASTFDYVVLLNVTFGDEVRSLEKRLLSNSRLIILEKGSQSRHPVAYTLREEDAHDSEERRMLRIKIDKLDLLP